MYYIVVLIYVNECFLNCQEVDSLSKCEFNFHCQCEDLFGE